MKKRLGQILLACALGLILLEGFSCLLLGLKLHRVTSAKTYFQSYGVELPAEGKCAWGDTTSLYPYVGYHYHDSEPCRHSGINAQGLVGEAFPAARDPAYYTILLLGGSVAEQLAAAKTMDRHALLEETLNQEFVSPNGRPFRVMNASIAAGQQPMQAIFFLLYGSLADAVISLEGYNEYNQSRSRQALENPPKIWYQLSQAKGSHLWAALLSWGAHGFYAGCRDSLFLSHSYSAFLLAYSWLSLAQRASSAAEISAFPQGLSLFGAQSNRLYVAHYRQYLEAISALAHARNMPVTFFIQPVPALFKALTPRELRVTGDLSYGASYLSMVRAIEQAPGVKLPIAELLEIFRDYEGELYRDPIHFSANDGNRMLAHAIAQRLGRSWRWRHRR